jgi:hypothetical protein
MERLRLLSKTPPPAPTPTMGRGVIFLLFLFFNFCVSAQTTKVVQVVTGSASVNSTADVVVNTGTSTNLTLPASPNAGRVIQVINHGTGDLLFSDQVWVSRTSNFDYLPSYPNEYRPLISTNSISIIWDSTNSRWRLLD